MYIRRKVYSVVDDNLYSVNEIAPAKENLYSVPMTEEEIALFSEFCENYYTNADEKAAATAAGIGAAAALGGAGYFGHQAVERNGGYKEVGKKAWDSVKGGAERAKNAVVEGSKKAKNAVVEGSEKAKDAVVEGSKKAKNAVVEGSKKAKDAVVESSKKAKDTVSEQATGVYGKAKGAVKDFMNLGGTKAERDAAKKILKTGKGLDGKFASKESKEAAAKLMKNYHGRNAILAGAGTVAAAGGYLAGKKIYKKVKKNND